MERKPQITLSSLDLERIEALLEKNSSHFPGRDAGSRTGPRRCPGTPGDATQCGDHEFHRAIHDAGTQKSNTLTLVYPKDMDGSADKVSIFAPWVSHYWACPWAMSSRCPAPQAR